MVVGHSTGELAAAYLAGFYTLEETLLLAWQIGEIASRLDGVMLHGRLPDAEIERLTVNLSSFNFTDGDGRHVTLSGHAEEMEAFLETHPDFVRMKLSHPWHHPDYARFSASFEPPASRQINSHRFVSGVTTRFETQLEANHWHQWLVNPIDFIQTMRTLDDRFSENHLDIVEIGFHPVLEKCCAIFKDHTHVSSMFRGEDDVAWILFQRRKLDQHVFLEALKPVIDSYSPGLDYGQPLAYQGFNSLEFTEFSVLLQPFFPTLAPQDFYRLKTIRQLIDRFGVDRTVDQPAPLNHRRNRVVIAGMSCRLPATVETLPQFWDMLISGNDQVRFEPGRGGSQAGYLADAASRFDHNYFNISQAEARTMDPQQILALELTEMLWKDAEIDPKTLNRKRVGVYIGAWNQEYSGDRTSVYHPGGTNPSIIAARISYHYDLRGPSWVSNTACSSSLLAIHYAAKDIEAGRVDYAIAGGVNMLLNESFSATMRNAGFLSKDDRCKTFDDTANGYVRAEGGGLVLLVNQSLADAYYAELTGSSTNQNGGRSQVITAPHPEAQEELIIDACRDAGIDPNQIAYLECHGTGTKIGDPIEISALQNTVARNRSDTCYIGSVKSNIGHLESAAGIAGLIKSVAALNYSMIPPNLHFAEPNRHIDFASYPIQVVDQPIPIDPTAIIGVSSFGFGGSNAHVIVKGAEEAVRKKIQPLKIPFDRTRGASLARYLKLLKSASPEPAVAVEVEATGPDVLGRIQTIMLAVTGVDTIDPELELLDQGLDSMSATEMLRQLEEEYGIEIEPDVLFEHPFIDQFAEQIEQRIAGQHSSRSTDVATRNTIDQLVNDLFVQLTGIQTIDPEIELTDQGLDSMSGTELISQLETSLKIDLGPEILFEYPFRDQFIDEIYVRTVGGLN